MQGAGALIALALGLTLAVGCGDDGGSADQDTASNPADTTGGDQAGSDTVGQDTLGQDTSVGPCLRQGFTAATQEADFDGDTWYFGYSGEAEPFDILSLQMFTETQTPGSFTVSDANYLDCETCVLVFSDCTGSSCAKTFLAYAGTVTITAWGTGGGDLLSGTMSDVELREVVIDGSFTSTPVANGETWCIDSVAFTAPVGIPTPTATCDPAQTAFVAATQSAERDADGAYGDSFFYNGYTAETAPRDWLTLESYVEFGGPAAPGSYDIVYDDYYNCSLCVLVSLGCDLAGNCTGADFMAVGGTLEVTTLGEVGTEFAATLRDLELFEHTIDVSGSTPVESGRSYCIPELAIGATITAPQ